MTVNQALPRCSSMQHKRPVSLAVLHMHLVGQLPLADCAQGLMPALKRWRLLEKPPPAAAPFSSSRPLVDMWRLAYAAAAC